MFFHSLKEEQLARIFGITDAVGVTLLSLAHPFPLLVEEEERIHGALLANTSHGALFRALGRITDQPTTRVRFPAANEAELPPARRIVNKAKFQSDQILRAALPCHEGFAKHIAYAFQFQRATSAVDRTSLAKMLVDDRTRHKVLDALCRRFVDPAVLSAYQAAMGFGYQAAKAVLNTLDLDRLLALSPPELWARFKTGDLIPQLKDRTEIAIQALADLASARRNRGEPAGGATAEEEDAFYEDVADRIRAAHDETLEAEDPFWMLARAELLGKRIEKIGAKVYFAEMAPFLSFFHGGVNGVEIDERSLVAIDMERKPMALRALFAADPALRVFYEPKLRRIPSAAEPSWTPGDTETLRAARWDQLAIYVAPAQDGNSVPVWGEDEGEDHYPLVNLFCFGLTPDGPRSVGVPWVRWREVQNQLAEFRPGQVAVVVPEPFNLEPTISQPIQPYLAKLLSQDVPVVYWSPVGGSELLVGDNAAFYQLPADAGTGGSSDRGPCAVILPGENYTTLTCVPRYAVDMVRRVTQAFFGVGSPRGRAAASTLAPTGNNDAWSAGARLVYDLMYAHAILPQCLPMYNGIELFFLLNKDRSSFASLIRQPQKKEQK